MAQLAYKLKGCDRVDRLPRLLLTEVNQRIFSGLHLWVTGVAYFFRRIPVARLSDTYDPRVFQNSRCYEGGSVTQEQLA